MVTSFERHDLSAQRLKVPRNSQEGRHQSPGFPLSSPPAETLASFKPSNGAATLPSNNLFLASDTFTSSLSDDDDGSSSGQDKFHLERYSQNTHGSQSTNPGQKRSFLPTGRVRKIAKQRSPGLNIVTNFSNEHRIPRSEGLVVDEVQSQRPRLGRRTTPSVISTKAEHVNQSMMDFAITQAMTPTAGKPQSEEIVNGAQKPPASQRRQGWEAVARLKELQAARKAATTSAKNSQALNPIQIPSSSQNPSKCNLNNVAGANGHSPDARSIVIGLSVPSSEAEAHRSKGAVDSTVSVPTPETPVIVITLAEETDSWKPPFLRRARPASSLYSAYPHDVQLVREESLPPVPRLPPNELAHAPGASITGSTAEPSHWDMDDQTSEDEKFSESGNSSKRISSESQERILPSEENIARHKSQGWWNLMLSPMLSRKGTITENDRNKGIETPPLPPMPDLTEWEKRNSVSSAVAESPETPRRLGLASARASIWSRWTSWEKQRAAKSHERQLDDIPTGLNEGKALSLGVEEARPIDVADNLGNGLAAEYYHACAVELLSAVRYFECQNHSCEEKVPQYHSVFEPEKIAEPSSETGKLVRPFIDPRQNGPVEGRSISGVTSYPEAELSPLVRQADTAAVLKATTVDTPKTGDGGSREVELETAGPQNATASNPAADSSPGPDNTRQVLQNPATSATVPSRLVQPALHSPGPVSPAMQQTMTFQGAVPMAEIDHPQDRVRSAEQTEIRGENQTWTQTQPPSVTIHHHTTYAESNPPATGPIFFETRREFVEPQPEMAFRTKGAAQASASEAASSEPHEADPPSKPGIISRFKSVWDKMRRKKNNKEGKSKKRRWTLLIGILLFLIVIASILLATLLTRQGTGTPVQSQWLNLTGYPPIPTGISTIAMPDAVKEQPGCVAPATMWSCALPKEDQAEIAPSNPNQPNFRFEITFENGTVSSNMTIPVDNASQNSSRIKARANDPFTKDLFTPNPAPPSRADQIFMGNTTDNITQPFQGEVTPFFMTFIPVFPVDPSDITNSSASISRLFVREDTNSSDDIPAPDVLRDGSAAPANLLPTSPYPTSQPIQLYNRGQADEHYGFYMYYDKAIFLESTAPINTSEFADNDGVVPDDENGGSTRDQARIRCTFSQTRFLVRMWTNAAFGANLLSPITVTNGTKTTNSSATDFNRPGSFPYPTTISLDRHGGNINDKAVYCYGVDDLQVIQDNVKSIVPELRGVGGQLINPAPPLVNGSVDAATNDFNPEAGGIDGGTGGCECVWQNWS
ncbi:hypothetical protein LTR10_022521 [Elasticomyces elasticus]|uniref:Glycoprotease family protein n=1 Tax=Exophiala sideris TaxID=1016849 RepID=A0ABR0J757_9EURO|nr:hypothetical protein LTR10_022521 [Elasticomyces elasticus]KAK5029471.1 hypothetical protein LTS07_005933 [Exophiala sideris]KAK5036831.1 hypothetical protein LTR13_005211 [Exophiala sideris]KAK5058101.1 hypothetical protein LTR69_007098 [Exophiala sideris]KAK5182060.1 hypothetical protein LTR44_005661 [Eurotiomycetes sp. CCFEE 6388]